MCDQTADDCALLVTAAGLAHALGLKPYSAAALAAVQKADKPVALHLRADWCPTCRAQDKLLESNYPIHGSA